MCRDSCFAFCYGIEFDKSISGKFRVFQYRKGCRRFIGTLTPLRNKQGWIFRHRYGCRSRFPPCSAVTRIQAIRKSMEFEIIKYPRFSLPRFPWCDCASCKED